MGWVTRANGRRFLYRSRRVNGRVVTEFLGAEGSAAAALHESAWKFARRAHARRKWARRGARDARARVCRRLAGLDRLTRDGDLTCVAGGLMAVLGHHRPNRGAWRMRRGHSPAGGRPTPPKQPGPRVEYAAPADDAEAAALFAAARAGDTAAVARLPALLADRGWVDSIGDIGATAARLLVNRVARGDPVLRAALTAKTRALRAELEGERPTVLERLLARRVVNSWLLTHAVEIELAAAADLLAVDPLDKLLARSQRLAEAVRELARVRKLQAPRLLARLQVGLIGPRTAAG